MLFIMESIIILLCFFICDYLVERVRGKKLYSRLLIRGLSSLIFSILLFYLTNQDLVFNLTFNLNELLISSSILLIINIIISLVLIRTNKKKEKKGFYHYLLKLLLIVLTLELTVFNYNHYLTLTNKEKVITDFKLVNLQYKNNEYTKIKENRIGFEIKLPIKDINSIYFPIKNKDNKLVTYNIKVLDKESNQYVSYNQTNSYRNISKSYYKTIHNTINTDTLLLEITKDLDGRYILDEIIINPVIPIDFSLIRVLLIISISLLFYLFNPKSIIYKTKIDSKLGKNIIRIFTCFLLLMVVVLTNLNYVFKNNNSYKYLYPLISVNEYQELTESLIKGKLYLEEEPSKILDNMDNPYNLYDREKQFNDSDEHYLWDVAYYKGHYYVYFGITPVLTTYLPYYLLTGNHIDNNIVNMIGIVVIIVSFISLISFIMKRYFKNNNVGILLLLSTFSLLANHFMILYAARRPDFYSIPVVYGIMFSLIGLNLWFRSKKEDGTLKKSYLLFGSICMALVSGCRPQLLLASFASIFIFWDNLKERKLFSKKSLKETICFILPYIIIGLFMMWYNYARFGSIFDFGANYNLTTNDMTARGFELERFPLAIYYYFLAMPRITNFFPFIETLPLNTSYIGITIYEKTFGGIFTLCPILLLSLFFYKFKNIFKEKMLYKITGLFTISAIIIALADSQMAGILPRYFLDFNWLLIISTILIILCLIDKYKNHYLYNKALDIFSKIIVVLIIVNLFLMFIDVSFSYQSILPSLFYKFYYLIQFWL